MPHFIFSLHSSYFSATLVISNASVLPQAGFCSLILHFGVSWSQGKPSKQHKEKAWKSWKIRAPEAPINQMGWELVDKLLPTISEENCWGISPVDPQRISYRNGHCFPTAVTRSVMHALLSFPSSCLTFLDLSFSSWNYLPNNILETKSLFQTLFLGGTPKKIVTMEVAQESSSSGWDSDLDHLEAAG